MRVHQNIIINGIDYGDRKSRLLSMFCNEGKWNNFIAPLLPKDKTEMTLVDMGCNAGMYLKMAKDAGFKKAIGIEADPNAYAMALRYLENNNLDCEVKNIKLCENFDYEQIPATDVTIMANFHYHIFMPVFLHYINILRRKTRMVIVVSAHVRTTHHYPDTDIASIRKYFRKWTEVGHIPVPEANGDPHPREMFSIAFRSELDRVPISIILDSIGRNGARHYRQAKESIKTKDFPFINPIILRQDGRIIDGSHRMACLERDGYKSAIVEWA